jgi:RNA recognition motif-containing protein
MPTKLYIGNLSFKVTDAELNELFATLNIPVASVRLIRDADTGRSRGFAFAELAPEADAERAIKELNGKVVEGRALTVNEARPQKKRDFGGGGGGGGGFGRGRGGHGGKDSRDRDRDRPKRKPQDYY